MEPAITAVAGGLGVIVLGLLGMVFRNGTNGSGGILNRIDKRTEKMVTLLEIIADRARRMG